MCECKREREGEGESEGEVVIAKIVVVCLFASVDGHGEETEVGRVAFPPLVAAAAAVPSLSLSLLLSCAK